jgi:ABC-2 type transport system ATP-binding protein
MLQRLGLIVTVIHDPLLIILDEPTSGLDPVGRKEVKDLIREFKNEGKSVVFTSHIINDVESIADRVILLKDRKIAYDGETSKLLLKGAGKKFLITTIDMFEQQKTIETSIENTQVEIEKILKSGLRIYSVMPVQRNLEDMLFSSNLGEV